MSKIFRIIFNCLLVLVIVILAGYLVMRTANKIEIYNVETGSMEDKIHAGDYILLYKKSNYKVGDVVTYKVNDYFITHRIVRIENDKVVTKGDANNIEDEEITLDMIVGKAVYWGGVLNFVINFKFAIIALLIGLYLLSCYFGNDEKNIKIEEKPKKDFLQNIFDDDIMNKKILNDVDTTKENDIFDIDISTDNNEDILKEDIMPIIDINNKNIIRAIEEDKEIIEEKPITRIEKRTDREKDEIINALEEDSKVKVEEKPKRTRSRIASNTKEKDKLSKTTKKTRATNNSSKTVSKTSKAKDSKTSSKSKATSTKKTTAKTKSSKTTSTKAKSTTTKRKTTKTTGTKTKK